MTDLQGNLEWYAQDQPAANNEKKKTATPPPQGKKRTKWGSGYAKLVKSQYPSNVYHFQTSSNRSTKRSDEMWKVSAAPVLYQTP
jgi:hypothetical protein